MSKTSFPFKTGSGLVGKLIVTLIVIGAIALVVKQPSEAAGWAKSAANLAGDAINGVGDFLQHLMA